MQFSIPRPIDVEEYVLNPAVRYAASSSLRVGSLIGDLAPSLDSGVSCCHIAASFIGFDVKISSDDSVD